MAAEVLVRLRRSFLLLALLLAPAVAMAPPLFAQVAAAQSGAGTLRARFIGNAAFEITDGTATLLTDFPYKSGAFGYMTYRMESVAPQGDVLCLITHAHDDHWDPRLFRPTRWQVAGPQSVTTGIEPSRVVPVYPRGRWKSLIIESQETPHEPKGHYSYLVRWRGQKLYFTGDTERSDRLQATGPVDTLFITPWLLRNCLKAGIKLQARRIVIYHHDDSEPLPQCGPNCSGPRQGDEIVLR
jgi:L-ascorbate metabolism protein UlaG (beta-lactamase superfamily)